LPVEQPGPASLTNVPVRVEEKFPTEIVVAEAKLEKVAKPIRLITTEKSLNVVMRVPFQNFKLNNIQFT
jgi:hypothetical protein